MKILHLTALAAALALSACATTGQDTALQQQLQSAQTENQQLQSQNTQLQSQLAHAQQGTPSPQATSAPGTNNGAISLVPPNAKAGECFARVTTPSKYTTESDKVLVSAASSRVVTTPPKYKWTTQRIMVSPETTKLVAVPATYKTTSKRILISAAHTKWVPGHGAIQRVDDSGQLMCLVEVPAKYKTVKVREVATAATTRKVTTPAKYKTIRVKEIAQQAGTKTIDIPAKYKTVSHTKKVKDSEVVWSRVVCHNNATSPLITQVQKALKKASFNPGPVDGLFGPLTARATIAYDKANSLPTSKAGVITYATLKSLGIDRP